MLRSSEEQFFPRIPVTAANKAAIGGGARCLRLVLSTIGQPDRRKPMANNGKGRSGDSARIRRLAKRAKDLDDMIARAAKMQKRIVEEIERIGLRDRIKTQRMTSSRRRVKRR